MNPILDVSRFHRFSYSNEESTCPVCLDPIAQQARTVGHLVGNRLMHCIHNECWNNYVRGKEGQADFQCVVCRGEFLVPESPDTKNLTILSLHERLLGLSESEMEIVYYQCYYDERSTDALRALEALPKPLKWNEVVFAIFSANEAVWVLSLTDVEKKKVEPSGAECHKSFHNRSRLVFNPYGKAA